LILRNHPSAEVEANKAAHWYDKQQSGLGREFLAALADAADTIQTHPRRYPLSEHARNRDVRELMLDRFPYLIAYEIKSEEEIVILAVAHAHRRPGYWKRRRGS
jgi:plasmid stabilization system protein ParE